MNSMADNSGGSGDGQEPEIIILAIAGESFHLFKGDVLLDQVLLVDGEFPKPILCVNFDTRPDVLRVMGEGFSLSRCWAIHPDIVERLRESEYLIETNA